MAAQLLRLTVTGLRCLDGLDLTLEPLTALIGANGAGKSTTIHALQYLFGQVSLDDDDFTDGDRDTEVKVTATFAHLPEVWRTQLEPWLDAEGALTITRSRVLVDGAPAEAWTVDRAQAPGFGAIRSAVAQGALVETLKGLWSKAQDVDGCTLQPFTTKKAALEVLDAYERDHPEQVTETTVDASLRFGAGGSYDLSEMIELLVLPALRDASQDASDSRGSTLGRLVDLTVRSGMDLDERLADLAAETNRAYTELLADAGQEKLRELADLITNQLASFAPGSSVNLTWDSRMPVFSAPPVRASIIESGHEAEVGRQGHGVQRAYVFSLLRALLEARRGEAEARPGLLLAVEEPEVYQHPVRARYVARVLQGLVTETDASTQVVYTTHSPFFVSVDDLPAVRLLRLATQDGPRVPPTPARTRATGPSLAEIAQRLDDARNGTGQPWTEERVRAQLPGLLGTTVSEGFFADAVALVEGDEDAGFIQGAADARGIDFAELGIAIIPVGGKDPLPLAHEVFRAVGVPTYVVFDTDVRDNGNTDAGSLRLNSILTDLTTGTANENPGTMVGAACASLNPTLRGAIEADVDPTHIRDTFATAIHEMGLSKEALKNGHLVRVATERLYRNGHTSSTLDSLVDRIVQMSPQAARSHR